MSYQYNRYFANKQVTHRPEHTLWGIIKYTSPDWEVELKNKFIDNVYINPDSNAEEKRKVIASILFQFRMVETFYLYARINNLYNYSYSYRDGYPEAGITFQGGLRIII